MGKYNTSTLSRGNRAMDKLERCRQVFAKIRSFAFGIYQQNPTEIFHDVCLWSSHWRALNISFSLVNTQDATFNRSLFKRGSRELQMIENNYFCNHIEWCLALKIHLINVKLQSLHHFSLRKLPSCVIDTDTVKSDNSRKADGHIQTL